MSPAWENFNSFSPISELESNDSDLFLGFVVPHGVSYNNPVDDPLFSAHRIMTDVASGINLTRTFYVSDEPVTVFGCQNQVSFV